MVRAALVLAALLVAAQAAPSGSPWVAHARKADQLAGPGYQVLGSADGDLDGDGHPDAVAVIGRQDEDKQTQGTRWLVIARRGPDGLLRPWAHTDRAVLCKTCGGVFGDPFTSVAIDHREVVVEHYAGSNWRWAYTNRYLWLDGAWRLAGDTETDTFTNDPDYVHERDHNLLTGRVIVKRSGQGLRGTQTYHELWVPQGGAKGPTLKLATRDDVVEHAEAWRGGADLSARVSGELHGDELWIWAAVSDDRVRVGDTLRLRDAHGKLIAPAQLRRSLTPGGYHLLARYSLAALGLADARKQAKELEGDPVLPATIEIVDDDGPDRPLKVLATSQGAGRYPGAIRLAPTSGLPTLESFDRARGMGSTDPRLDALTP